MKHVTNYYLRGLEQRQAVAFFDKASLFMQKLEDEKFKPVLMLYMQAVEDYKKSFEKASHDIIWTEQITIEEQNCISLWIKVRKLTDSLLINNAKISSETGKKIDCILNLSGGDPTKLSPARRTSLFQKLINLIEKGLTEEELTQVNAMNWFKELKRSSSHLNDLENKRFLEFPDIYITASNDNSRKNAEKAYYKVIEFLNSMYIYLEDKLCGEIIDDLNNLIYRTKGDNLFNHLPDEETKVVRKPVKKPSTNNDASFFPLVDNEVNEVSDTENLTDSLPIDNEQTELPELPADEEAEYTEELKEDLPVND